MASNDDPSDPSVIPDLQDSNSNTLTQKTQSTRDKVVRNN